MFIAEFEVLQQEFIRAVNALDCLYQNANCSVDAWFVLNVRRSYPSLKLVAAATKSEVWLHMSLGPLFRTELGRRGRCEIKFDPALLRKMLPENPSSRLDLRFSGRFKDVDRPAWVKVGGWGSEIELPGIIKGHPRTWPALNARCDFRANVRSRKLAKALEAVGPAMFSYDDIVSFELWSDGDFLAHAGNPRRVDVTVHGGEKFKGAQKDSFALQWPHWKLLSMMVPWADQGVTVKTTPYSMVISGEHAGDDLEGGPCWALTLPKLNQVFDFQAESSKPPKGVQVVYVPTEDLIGAVLRAADYHSTIWLELPKLTKRRPGQGYVRVIGRDPMREDEKTILVKVAKSEAPVEPVGAAVDAFRLADVLRHNEGQLVGLELGYADGRIGVQSLVPASRLQESKGRDVVGFKAFIRGAK
jgi:hypothetical protein